MFNITPSTSNGSRPLNISGCTYKFKPPITDHAIYVTINGYVGETGYTPYEVFINSKNPDTHVLHTVLMTTITYAMQHNGDLDKLIEELIAIHDPKEGYFGKSRISSKNQSVYYPSIVSEIGYILKQHMAAHSDMEMGIKEEA